MNDEVDYQRELTVCIDGDEEWGRICSITELSIAIPAHNEEQIFAR